MLGASLPALIAGFCLYACESQAAWLSSSASNGCSAASGLVSGKAATWWQRTGRFACGAPDSAIRLGGPVLLFPFGQRERDQRVAQFFFRDLGVAARRDHHVLLAAGAQAIRHRR